LSYTSKIVIILQETSANQYEVPYEQNIIN